MRHAYLIAAAAVAALVVAVPLASGDPPLAPTITSPSVGNAVKPTLTGTAPAGSTVTLYADKCPGPVDGTAMADGSGNFQILSLTPVKADAKTTFYARAMVGADTSACSAPFVYTEDSKPPAAPTVKSGPPNPTASQSATFTFSDTDAVAGYVCNLDGTPSDCGSSGSQSYSGLGEGVHTFSVSAVDAAGNQSASSSDYKWTIDLTPPPKPALQDVPTNPSGSGSATFSFIDGEDPHVSYVCRLDGSSAGCTSPQSYNGLNDGSHTFSVVAVDAVGNASDAQTYKWTIDQATGLVTITEKPPLLTNSTSASFSFSTGKPGSSFECSLDGAAFSACASPQLYSDLGNGAHTFSVRAVSLGNKGPATSYSWTVDTIPPHTTITSAPPSSSNSAEATFEFVSSEAASSFVCSFNSGGFTPCTSPATYSGLGDGSYTFRVEAVDPAGNADPSAASYTWQISGVGPVTKDLKPPTNVTRLRRNVGYGRLQLRWVKPRDTDYDHIGVYVTTSPKTPPRKLVYSGKSQSYTDRHFKNGQYYRYLIVSYDHAKNASGGTPASVGPSALMLAPRNGAALGTVPTFQWAPVRGASFYNVQLYTHGRKVLSAWPRKARQLLTRSWSYRGHRYSLRRGVYVWYVWPGFGPRTKSRYGQLLGYASFRVR